MSGEPGIASSATPTRRGDEADDEEMVQRGEVMCRPVRLAAVERFGTLRDLRLHDFLGDDNTVFIIRAFRRLGGILVVLVRLVVAA